MRHRYTPCRWRMLFCTLLLSIASSTLAQPSAPSMVGMEKSFGAIGSLGDSIVTDSVAYSADHIRYDLDSKVISLTGKAEIHFGRMTLSGYRIRFITEKDLVIAEGHALPGYPDSILGLPRFSDGKEWFTGSRMTYNIRNKRGVVEGGYSESGTDIYGGEAIKRTGHEQLDVREGTYTTCTDKHSHYCFHASQMRIIVGDRVIARPVVMEVADVPMFWFPFGVFFVNKDRHSGFLSPRMGENLYSGRYMRGLGYYFAPNDYIGGQAVVDMDEKNGYTWNTSANYARRYHLRGGIASRYSKDWGEDPTRVWTLGVRHRQELTPRSALTANINYTSTSRPISTAGSTPATDLYQVYNSTLGYSRSWETGYSLRAELWRSQNLQNNQLSQRVPSVSISSGTQYFIPQSVPRGPRAQAQSRDPNWYERLTYNWRWSGTNTGTRGPSDKTIYDTWVLEEQSIRGDSVIRYYLTFTVGTVTWNDDDDGTYRIETEDGVFVRQGRIRIVDGEPSKLKLLSLYSDDDTGWAEMDAGLSTLTLKEPLYDITTWQRKQIADQYTRTTSQSAGIGMPLPTPRWLNVTPSLSWGAMWTSRPDTANMLDPDTRHNVNAGINSSATFYGTFPAEIGPLKALRHVVTPSVGAQVSISNSRRGGAYILGGKQVHGDTSRIVSFGLRNVLQAKAMWKDEEKRFDQLVTMSTTLNYNADAETHRWSDPVTSIRVNPSQILTSNISLRHSLYDDNTRLDWRSPRLQSASITTNFKLSGKGTLLSEPGDEGFVSQRTESVDSRGLDRSISGWSSTKPEPAGSGQKRGEGWSFNLRHTYRWTRPISTSVFRPEPIHQVDLSAGFAPYKDWRVNASTHYDIQNNRRDGDTINLTRKLHCWNAQFNWVLKGAAKGYYFRINVLQIPDVKIESASDRYR
jgi:hypothetical protein